MTYTIIYKGDVYHTNWFESQNHYRTGMVVINRINNTYTNDGLSWKEIEEDHL